jgi:hypothetical protein
MNLELKPWLLKAVDAGSVGFEELRLLDVAVREAAEDVVIELK